MTIQQEIDAVIKKMELFRKSFRDDEMETILAEAAQPAQDAMRAEAPQSKAPHLIRDGGGKLDTNI